MENCDVYIHFSLYVDVVSEIDEKNGKLLMDNKNQNSDDPKRPTKSKSPTKYIDPDITGKPVSPKLSPTGKKDSPTKPASGKNSPAKSPPGRESPGKYSPKNSPSGGSSNKKSPSKSSDKSGSRISKESQVTRPSGEQSPDKKSKASISGGVDALNTEFIYYSAVLRTFTPTLSREFDKVTAHLWMKKLFGPEYHSTVLKPKRNKYLLYLTITIYNDETYGIFRQEPPCGVLPEIRDIPLDKEFPPAEWELEKQWEETIDDLPDDMKFVDCYLHDGNCPPVDNNLNIILDAQFQFFLWLTRPYVGLLTDPENKTTVACWIQQLCGIAPEDSNCSEMKNLRNDYMQVLLGYVHDLRVEGPFRRMPAAGAIPPLSMWYEHCEGDGRYSDPVEKEKEEFLASQPLPQTGAFAYINVTGEMFGTQI